MNHHLRSERGSILMLTAAVIVVMLAVAAISLDAAFMYDQRNRLSAAADAAALAAAQEYKRVGTSADLQVYANHEVALHAVPMGLTVTSGASGVTTCPAPGGTSQVAVCVNSPPQTGPFAGVNKYVEVFVTRSTPTFFANIFGRSAMTVGTRAVAGPGDSSGCLIALNTNDPVYTTELDVGYVSSGGTVTVDTQKCGVVSNGGFAVGAGDSVKAKEIDVHAASGTVSGTTYNGTATPSPPTYSTPVANDPFSDMDQAALFGTSWTCGWTGTSQPSTGGASTPFNGIGQALMTTSGTSYTLNPGVYCGDDGTPAIKIGLNISTTSKTLGVCDASRADDIVHFNPGVYILNGGGIDWKHSCVDGAGVTFYFTGTPGSHDYRSCNNTIMSTDPPDIFVFSAPTSGNYEGLLFIKDRTQATSCTTTTNRPVIADFEPSNMTIDGAIYFPIDHVKYGASTTSTGKYTVLVAGTINFPRTALLKSDFVGAGLSGSPVRRSTSAE